MRVFSLPLLLLASGCSGKIATIKLDFQDTTTVQGGGLLSELVGSLGFNGFTEMNLVDAQELKNQGVEPGDITGVYLTEITLTAVDPDGADLSFISSMDVLVESPDLPQVQVASQSSFPAGTAEVSMDLDDVDLTDYVVSESMTLFTDVTGNQPPDTTQVRAYVALEVEATIQGALNQARKK